MSLKFAPLLSHWIHRYLAKERWPSLLMSGSFAWPIARSNLTEARTQFFAAFVSNVAFASAQNFTYSGGVIFPSSLRWR